MLRAVDDGHLEVDHRIARDDAVLHRLFDAGLDRLRPLLAQALTLDLPVELEARAARQRLEIGDDVTPLPLAAGLADVPALGLDRLGDGLAIGDLWTPDVGSHFELPPHPVDDDLEVQLTHARDQRLRRLGIGVNAESRILLREARERERHLLFVGLRFGLDRDLDDRLRELDRLEHDWLVRIAQGVAGEGLLQPDGGGDVAGRDELHVLAVVGVHQDDPPDPLAAVLRRVEDGVARLEEARVDPEERELAHERVAHDLEGERREGLRVARLTHQRLATLRVDALDRRDVQRRRQVVDDRVEHRLYALVA